MERMWKCFIKLPSKYEVDTLKSEFEGVLETEQKWKGSTNVRDIKAIRKNLPILSEQ